MSGAVKKIRSIGELFRLKEFNINISLTDIIYIVTCYISSACTVLDGRTPFALCAYGAAFTGRSWPVFLIVTLAGIIRFRFDSHAFVYIFTLVAFTAFMSVFLRGKKNRGILLGAFLFVVSLCADLVDGFKAERFIWNLAEGLILWGGVTVFKKAVNLISNYKDRKCISDFDILALGAFAAVVIRCTSGLPLLFGLSFASVLAIVLLMVLNLKGDPAVSVTMGVVCAVALWDNGAGMAATVGVYAMSSIAANSLKIFGKWGCILGFVIINTMYVSFLPSEILPFDIFEIVISGLVLLIIPQRVTDYFGSFSEKRIGAARGVYPIKDKNNKIIASGLLKLADSYRFLAHSYKKAYTPGENSKAYIINMLDIASSKICPECGLKYNCWERGYKESYKSMLQMLETATQKGEITVGDIPEQLRQKCIKPREFADSFNKMYNVYKVEKIWQSRVNECRELVISQLEGVVKSVEHLAGEMDSFSDITAERELSIRLDEEKIAFKDIDFIKGNDDEYTVDIIMDSSRISPGEEMKIAGIIKELTGISTSKTSESHCVEGLKVTFKPTRRYIITAGSSMAAKDGEKLSGDSVLFCEDMHGDYVVAIADAVGSGPCAAHESTDATELLKTFINAGIEAETGVELINSALLLRSSGDKYVALDICVVDALDGNIKLIKSGAASGYIKNEYGVSCITSNTFAYGVLPQDGGITTELFTLTDKATVVMVSDGLSEIFNTDRGDALKGIIEKTDTENPQILASVIMKNGLRECKNKPKDDMTVLVLNIQKA